MAAREDLKTRGLMALILVLAGAALLAYGLLVHGAVVSPMATDVNSVASDQPETSLIREVAVGGLTRDAEGLLRKTYSGQAPKACPT